MNLKEAFRYRKYLSNLFDNARERMETSEENLMTITTHLYSETVSGKDDVVVPDESKRYGVDKLVSLCRDIMAEQRLLMKAIAEHKKHYSLEYDYDTVIECARMNRVLANSFDIIRKQYTATKTTSYDIDYTFNANGEQVSYRYKKLIEQNPLFPEPFAEDNYMECITEADRLSNIADEFATQNNMSFTPKFNVNECFESVIRKY